VLSVRRPSSRDLGGQLAFGPDRLLYAGLGFGRRPEASQDLSVLYGKILRIDPRRAGRSGYRIPPDNPFVSRPGARPEIWAYGLRNPYRFSFDSRTGAMAVADVGEQRVEEVNFLRHNGGAGSNFGWPVFEGGRRRTPGTPEDLVFPVLERRHARLTCAVVGGYVFRAPGPRSMRGRYLYGDVCSGRIRSARLRPAGARGDRFESMTVPYLSSFGEDARRRLYAISFLGDVYRLVRR
jgi:glucose/sorbosone dehydrogenase